MVLNKMAKNHLGERFVIRKSADSSGMPIRGGVGCSCNCLIIGPTNCQISVMVHVNSMASRIFLRGTVQSANRFVDKPQTYQVEVFTLISDTKFS